MSTRAWAWLALLGGAATFAVFVGFNFLPAVTAAYEPGALPGAVSAFQRSATMADLAAVFGDPPNAAIVTAQDAVNTLDLYAFIPAYTLFLVATAAMIGGGGKRTLHWAAIASAFVAAGADAVETWAQLRVTAGLENSPGAYLAYVAPSHWVKYFALAASAFFIAGVSLLGAPRRWALGVLGLLPLPCVLAVWTGAVQDPRLISGPIAAFWVALLALAAREALRGRG